MLEVDNGESVMSMLLPLIVSSRSSSLSYLFYSTEDFAICHLQSALRASQQDILRVQEQFVSRECLYLEEITDLKNKLNVGSSKPKGHK